MPFATDEEINSKLNHSSNLVNRHKVTTIPAPPSTSNFPTDLPDLDSESDEPLPELTELPSEVGDYPEIDLPPIDHAQEAGDKRRHMQSLRARQLHRVHTNAQDDVAIAPLHNGGRRPGDKNLSLVERADIGAAANLSPLSEVVKQFGVSQHHAHELKHGKITNEGGQDSSLVDAVNDRLSKPNKLAIDKLTSTLMQLDDNKIKKIKSPKAIVSIASTLSQIVRNTTPIIKEADEDKGIKLLVYAPVMKKESDYNTVDVKR